ncbi:hypothetical protein [Lysinibacillus capsici]|uniref:hypothetical protein n=1 Tax=Lysinibacillus capsici TaxID=2115968 RepID=UPI000E1FE94D|nr:hypothetical protein [Lysinibacillus capsici]RDV26298.1 hypothetical protein C7B89_21955 [Lysinibacillus capsici]
MKRVIEVILSIFVGVFLFGIFAITFQVIGGDSSNKAAIIGGILSMFGGLIGAFGAYFIAKWQMNVLLERQYEKEKSKFTWEIKVNKKLEVISILNNKINELDLFRKEFLSHNSTVRIYLRKMIKENPDIKAITLPQGYIEECEKFLDMITNFALTFQILFSYKSFYSKDFLNLLEKLDKDLLQSYKIIIKDISKNDWEIKCSPEEFYDNWYEEDCKIEKEIHELDTKFLKLLDYLINEVSEMLPDE